LRRRADDPSVEVAALRSENQLLRDDKAALSAALRAARKAAKRAAAVTPKPRRVRDVAKYLY
jgi:hypothetical protein